VFGAVCGCPIGTHKGSAGEDALWLIASFSRMRRMAAGVRVIIGVRHARSNSRIVLASMAPASCRSAMFSWIAAKAGLLYARAPFLLLELACLTVFVAFVLTVPNLPPCLLLSPSRSVTPADRLTLLTIVGGPRFACFRTVKVAIVPASSSPLALRLSIVT